MQNKWNCTIIALAMAMMLGAVDSHAVCVPCQDVVDDTLDRACQEFAASPPTSEAGMANTALDIFNEILSAAELCDAGQSVGGSAVACQDDLFRRLGVSLPVPEPDLIQVLASEEHELASDHSVLNPIHEHGEGVSSTDPHAHNSQESVASIVLQNGQLVSVYESYHGDSEKSFTSEAKVENNRDSLYYKVFNYNYPNLTLLDSFVDYTLPFKIKDSDDDDGHYVTVDGRLVNKSYARNQRDPSICTLGTKYYVISWQSNHRSVRKGSYKYNIYYSVYSNDDHTNPLIEEKNAPPEPTSNSKASNLFSKVVELENNCFLLVWSHREYDSMTDRNVVTSKIQGRIIVLNTENDQVYVTEKPIFDISDNNHLPEDYEYETGLLSISGYNEKTKSIGISWLGDGYEKICAQFYNFDINTNELTASAGGNITIDTTNNDNNNRFISANIVGSNDDNYLFTWGGGKDSVINSQGQPVAQYTYAKIIDINGNKILPANANYKIINKSPDRNAYTHCVQNSVNTLNNLIVSCYTLYNPTDTHPLSKVSDIRCALLNNDLEIQTDFQVNSNRAHRPDQPDLSYKQSNPVVTNLNSAGNEFIVQWESFKEDEEVTHADPNNSVPSSDDELFYRIYKVLEPEPEAILGFTFVEKNAQGQPEYRQDSTDIRFVLLPGGSFDMGSPAEEPGHSPDQGPVHTVTLSPFLIAKYEVTQAQYESVMTGNTAGLEASPSSDKGDKLPVVRVSWDDLYLEDGFLERTGLALPSEAQWEYACRAGTSGAYAGNGVLDDMGWFLDNSGGTSHEVGGKRPNQFGLHDMYGNVLEWCEDVYRERFYDEVQDGLDPVSKSGQDVSPYELGVMRGGAFDVVAQDSRSSSRFSDMRSPPLRRGSIGFRPARPLPVIEPEPEPEPLSLSLSFQSSVTSTSEWDNGLPHGVEKDATVTFFLNQFNFADMTLTDAESCNESDSRGDRTTTVTGCYKNTWELPVNSTYTLTYSSGYTHTATVTKIEIHNNGVEETCRTIDGEVDCRTEKENDSIFFYDGSNKLYEVRDLSIKSGTWLEGEISSDFTTAIEGIDTPDIFDLSFYWGDWGDWGTYHYDYKEGPQETTVVIKTP